MSDPARSDPAPAPSPSRAPAMDKEVAATMQLQAIARNSLSQLPLEEVQQLAAVFDVVKRAYVEPVDEKKLINDAISGMVSGLDPHSQYLEGKNFKEFREEPPFLNSTPAEVGSGTRWCGCYKKRSRGSGLEVDRRRSWGVIGFIWVSLRLRSGRRL